MRGGRKRYFGLVSACSIADRMSCCSEYAAAAMTAPPRFASPPPLDPPRPDDSTPADLDPSSQTTHQPSPQRTATPPLPTATARASPPPSERSLSPASTIRARSRSNSRLTIQPEKPAQVNGANGHAAGVAEGEGGEASKVPSAEGLKVVVGAPSPAGVRVKEGGKGGTGKERGRRKRGWSVDVAGAVGTVGSLWRGAGGTEGAGLGEVGEGT